MAGCSLDPELQGNQDKTKTNHGCNDLGRDAGTEKSPREKGASEWEGWRKRRRRELGSEEEKNEGKKGGREEKEQRC